MSVVEAGLYEIGIALTEFASAFDYTFVQIEEMKTQFTSVFNS